MTAPLMGHVAASQAAKLRLHEWYEPLERALFAVAPRPQQLGNRPGRFCRQAPSAAVFGRIGARVIWIDKDWAVRTGIMAPFTLVLVDAEQITGHTRLFMDALGFAAPRVRRAYVFYDRIQALNIRSPPSIPSI